MASARSRTPFSTAGRDVRSRNSWPRVPLELGGQDPDAFLVEAVGRLVEVVRDDLSTWRPILFGPEGTPATVHERIARDREVVRVRVQTLL